jgi:cell division protein FtsI (penicillin-binding protein 3)
VPTEQDPKTRPARPRADFIVALSAVVLTVMLAAVMVRVVQVQLRPSESLTRFLDDRVAHAPQMGQRGDIVDRRGRVLATTRVGHRLFVDPSALVPPFGELVNEVARVTGVSVDEVANDIVGRVSQNEQRVAQGRSPIRYVSIGGILTDEQLEAAKRLKLPGVHLEQRPVRETPGGSTVASIVGKVGVDDNGLLGAELAFDEQLPPKPGRLESVRDARGRPLWIEPVGYKAPTKGDEVRLTIDAELQRIAEEELRRGVHDADAAGGRLVMVEPSTGDVLAMVDYVREDLLSLAEPPKREVLRGRVVEPDSTGTRYRTIRPDPARKTHPAMARNRAVEDVYEPGSTFKCFVWSSVVERGLARTDEVFDTHDGVWATDYGRVIRDVVDKPTMTWSEVLIFSSNIGMVQGAARLGFANTRHDILRFGFGKPTNVGLPGESGGLVTSMKSWSKYTQTSIASGYEIAVTPLQVVRAFCVFARNGDLAGTLPNLRLRIDEETDAALQVRTQVLPPWVAYLTRDTLVNVGKGMEQRARLRFKDEPDEVPLRHSIFGKSGTAEIPRPDGKGYFRGQYNSSFLAGAPADNPRVVIVVVIDDPGPEMIRKRMHYGTATAGPVVRRVVRRSLEYLGVPAVGDPVASMMAELEQHHED